MNLKIIFVGNNTLIGRYEEGAYPIKGILHQPQSVVFGNDPKGREMIGMQNILGNPSSLEIVNASLMYDLKDEVIINLYVKATTGLVTAKDLGNVRSIKDRNN